MRDVLISIVVVMLSAGPVLCAEDNTPWWKDQKIVFMWGQWPHARVDKSQGFWGDEEKLRSALLPRDVFRNVASAGGTVFTEIRWYNPAHARYAHEFGLRYFAAVYACQLPNLPGGRTAVKQSGEDHWFKCPLDQSVYERWLLDPYIDGVRDGLIDGIVTDWERYGRRGEAGICYCDDCFSHFPPFATTGEALPEKLSRFAWVTQHSSVDAYEANYSKRRIEMFTRIREEFHAANPRLLFSSYGTVFSDFTRAMNTPETPFIFLDCRHYYNDDRQAFWESYGARLREEGYLYIPGGWVNALFGAQASQVSAARWIYEASINEDGCWLWFERELDDEILRAYATAEREIQRVLSKVGPFLFNGTRDPNFATPVEWTGRPELEEAVKIQTYHLDDEHLVHVNNVHSEWPVRVRLRFPRLGEDGPWAVRDAMSGVYYAHNAESADWTRDELRAGVVVTLEARTDLFLELSTSADAATSSHLVPSREFSVLPDHASAAENASPIKRTIALYTLKNSIYGEALDTVLAKTEKVFDLPKDAWRFKMDKEDLGAGNKWYLPDASTDGWVDIETESFWGGKGDIGAGWYRRNVDVPALPEGKRVYLHFGAVDERLMLWIDGACVGDYDREPSIGWDKPFAIDVTGKLTPGKRHFALRVHNIGAAGGVWKPVSIRVGEGVVETKEVDVDEAPAGPEGRLVYTATEPLGFGGPEGALTIGNAIRTVDADGETQSRIRHLRGHLWSSQYSPDGTQIAFVHDSGGRGQIFVMNADGSDATNLSANDFCDRSPKWSPDGERIAFLSDRTGDWDIHVMNADGSDQRRLAGNPGLDRAVAWSPDGKRIAWESHVAGWPAIWVVDIDGESSRPLIAPDREVTITEGNVGKNAVFNFAEVAWPFADNTFIMTAPVWSPKGDRIAAVLLDDDSSRSVVTVTPDGSQILNVIKWLPSADNLTWSPDGKYLAGTWRTAPQETERSGIFVAKADGTDESRYGKWLVDVSPQGPRLGGARRHGLMSWYSHGSAQPRRVVKTFASVAWSADAKTIAFSSDMDPSGAFYVYTIDPEGGAPQRLDETRSAWPNEVMWRPIPPGTDGQ